MSKLAKDMPYQCCVAETCKTLLVAQLPTSVFFQCSFPFVLLALYRDIVPPVVCVPMDYDLSLTKVDGHEVIHSQGHKITFYM